MDLQELRYIIRYSERRINDKNEPVSYGDEGLYRKGGIAGMLGIGYGLTLGKHVYTYEKELEPDKIKNLRFHENYHIQQINDMGLVKFMEHFL